MPLSFLTQDQRFIFVDHKTHQIIHPMNTFAGSTYDVYVVAKNPLSTAVSEVRASVWHSGLGKGPMDQVSGLTQPAKVEVPAAAFGLPGQATIAFQFTPSKSCRGTLHIQIEPKGPAIRQDVTVHEPLDRQVIDPPSEKIALLPPKIPENLLGAKPWQSA